MRIFVILAGIALLCGCSSGKDKKLPILGRQEISGNDTLYQRIADFRFMNQDSAWISNETFAGKAYVADFFFTSCPSICPIMKKQMLRVYKTFKGNSGISFLSHTIDPRHDSVPVLHEYAADLGVSSDQWHFVTGTRDSVYSLAEKSYMVATLEDETAPGGFIHGGHFILVDKNRHIRGIYDGTSEESVDQLIKDIPLLLNEGTAE
ncbi:protein SCO1/2 [Anseongella ginsenosidimutans]|uniref:Protein SCO1/2 n=1 Tax=Anseongella ginsenosidimutans TaxID=496056 RepID=A0A4R3KUG1_9SPHI|nr:SCO family protein [Anseongella ginsenosidimutans]QEC53258.1 SCO family protein [Anseongella ginsenosidimutans]TCS87895.1 protein SCO1/2 [Anseongella ginsenosidimutans]